jgi:hypothetical protein
VEALAAAVNDFSRLRELCPELLQTIRSYALEADDIDHFAAMIDAVGSEFRNLAEVACSFLARSVMNDIEQSAMQELFCDGWENGTVKVAATIAITLQDYFGDISSWLPPCYLDQFTKEVVSLLNAAYLRTFIKNAQSREAVFTNELTAASRLVQVTYRTSIVYIYTSIHVKCISATILTFLPFYSICRHSWIVYIYIYIYIYYIYIYIYIYIY